MWSRGTKLISETSPELGVGVVVGVEGKHIDVFFPDADRHLRLSITDAGIERIRLREGDAVRLHDGSVTTVERIKGPIAVLADGRRAQLRELWPHLEPPTLIDHLASSRVDPLLEVLNRVDGHRLLNVRQRVRAAELSGARVEIVPRQIDTAARMLEDERVRWMLADEPETGRMAVACMVAASMIRRRRARRVVVIAPHRRAIEWLGELYRRFHQVFVHIDHERWQAVKDDVDIDANPFEVHPLCVVSSGLLAAEEVLLEHLLDATPDLVILDEAHQAFRYIKNRLFLPLATDARHALVLTGPVDQIGDEEFFQFADALGLAVDETKREVRRVAAMTPRESEQACAWSFSDTFDEASTPTGFDQIPDDFDETLRRFCIDAAEQLEMRVEEQKGTQAYYFEYGLQVKVPSIPGLRPGMRFLGTFDRETALRHESLDFFASGHPLVEGLLAELQQSARGRVGAVRLRRRDARGFHGLYLLVVEGTTAARSVRLIPLMGVSDETIDEHRARELYAALDMGIELGSERVQALMERVAHHPLLESLDATTLSQAILVAVMDQS